MSSKRQQQPAWQRLVATTGPAAGYVGSESCAQCHSEIAHGFHGSIAMGRSAYQPAATSVIEDFTSAPEFYHEPSRQYLRMDNVEGKYFQSRWQLDAAGKRINEMRTKVDYVIGSGNHVRSYVHAEPGGKLYELPVAWYTQEKRWGMNPGYDHPRHEGFSRRITYQCAFCHAAYPAVPKGQDRFDLAEDAIFPEGLKSIDCERCHGPAANHVELATRKASPADVRKSIVNPITLPPDRQMDVCMQCHLETTSGKLPGLILAAGRPTFSFRPGEKLEDYRIDFDHPKGTGHDDKFEIAGQAYRLRMSKCFIASAGRMTCTTCHDPHEVPKDRTAAVIQSCLVCHIPGNKDCTEKPDLRAVVKDNCIQCHMPQRRTQDAVHVVMTDHNIQRHRQPADELLAPCKEPFEVYRGGVALYHPSKLPPREENLYLGMAHISDGAHVEKGIGMLSNFLGSGAPVFDAVYGRGIGYRMLGQLDNALTDFKQAIDLQPDHPQAWMSYGDAFKRRKDFNPALNAYQQAVRLRPESVSALSGQGVIQSQAGDLEGAAKSFRSAITAAPFDAHAHFNLANVLARQGQFQKAEVENWAGLRIDPSDPEGWMSLTQNLFDLKRTGEAVEPAARAVISGGQRPEAWRLYLQASGTDMAKLKEVVGSAFADDEWLEGAAQLVHSSGDGIAPGDLHLAAQMPSTAAEGFGTVLPPGSSEEVVAQLATAMQKAGSSKAARSLLDAALRKSGNSARLLNARAWLSATSKDDTVRNGAESERLAKKAADLLGRDNLFVSESLAAAAAESGRFPEAVQHAIHAVELARGAGKPDIATQITERLNSYRAGKAWRE